MKLNQYAQTLGGALKENHLTRYVLLGLVLSNVFLAMFVMSKKDIVVMVPPNLRERSELAENKASAGLKETWATYVATMLGNVTPRTAPYLVETLGKFIAPAASRELLDGITEQTKTIQDEQVTIQFTPNQVFYLPNKDVVVVSGEFSMRGMRENERRMVRTYEIGIDVSNYMVRVDSLTVYEGPWNANRDQIEEKKAKKERAAEAARSANG
jgi:conjugal transfer pilus assembly protein TraE